MGRLSTFKSPGKGEMGFLKGEMSAWTPNYLSGLLLWLKADAVSGVADGGAVAQWSDLSGKNNHVVQATQANKPLYNANGIDGTPEIAFCYRNMAGTIIRYFTAPAGVTFNRNNCTIFAVGRPQSRDLTSGSCGVFCLTGNATLNFGWGPGSATAYNGGILNTTKAIGYQPHAIGLTSNASAFRLWVDGVGQSFAAASSGAQAGGSIGIGGTLYLYGALKELIIYNRGLSDAEYDQLQAYAQRRYFAVPNKLLVCDGDSLTTGYGALNNVNMPSQLWGMLGKKDWKIYNAAVAGQQTSAMSADAATEIDPLFSASNAKNILVCWSGLLDIYTGGQTPAQTWTRISNYCSARRVAGFKVVVCTCLPSGFISDVDRAGLNALIRGNWATCADALADIAGDARIGDDGDNTDPTYYNNDDGNTTHMTAAGYAIVAQIVKTAVGPL